MRKVMIIGNGGGGKTTLAYRVAERYALPLVEIDTLQFQPQWQRTGEAELREQVVSAQALERWVIDGFGPWDLIEARAALADTIIFVDHPIWVHFWWACERQIAAARGEQRLGGPNECDLRDVTKQMFETIWWVHEHLRPRLVELVEQHRTAKQVIWIRSPEELDAFSASLWPFSSAAEGEEKMRGAGCDRCPRAPGFWCVAQKSDSCVTSILPLSIVGGCDFSGRRWLAGLSN